MATYKGITFPDHVAPLARHMHSVDDHREALAALSGTWDTLALLAHLSNLKADMSEVRASFGALTGELLVCLAEEMLALADGTLGHQAQIAVNVLTRNLFERTADIGFLATDSAIVDACIANDAAVFDRVLESGVLAIGGVMKRLNIGDDWMRYFGVAFGCLMVSGIMRLLEHFVITAEALHVGMLVHQFIGGGISWA